MASGVDTQALPVAGDPVDDRADDSVYNVRSIMHLRDLGCR
jgi:hypothetical protein